MKFNSSCEILGWILGESYANITHKTNHTIPVIPVKENYFYGKICVYNGLMENSIRNKTYNNIAHISGSTFDSSSTFKLGITKSFSKPNKNQIKTPI